MEGMPLVGVQLEDELPPPPPPPPPRGTTPTLCEPNKKRPAAVPVKVAADGVKVALAMSDKEEKAVSLGRVV